MLGSPLVTSLGVGSPSNISWCSDLLVTSSGALAALDHLDLLGVAGAVVADQAHLAQLCPARLAAVLIKKICLRILS